MKFPGHCWKYVQAHLTPWYYFFYWCERKWGSGGLDFNFIEGWCIVSFETFKYFIYFIRVIDYCNYLHFMAAFWTYQRVHLINLFDEPCPASFKKYLRRSFVICGLQLFRIRGFLWSWWCVFSPSLNPPKMTIKQLYVSARHSFQ